MWSLIEGIHKEPVEDIGRTII